MGDDERRDLWNELRKINETLTHREDEAGRTRIALARIEERQVAHSTSTSAQFKSLTDKIDGLATTERVNGIENRVTGIEKNQRWVTTGILGAVGTAAASALGLTKKIGL